VILLAVLPQAWCQAAAQDAGKPLVNTGYLEHVTFERLPGRERVVLKVSKETSASLENQSGSAVLVRLENLFVPAELRRPLSASGLANVVQITPQQRTAGGRFWVLAIIDLKQKVPYSMIQVGTNILIDFNVASLASATAGEAKPSPAPAKTPAEPVRSGSPSQPAAPEKPASGPRIFLDVQDADIKAVFRLLSEYAQVSIVSGDDVKGTLSVHLRDVPWDQALDTVLRIKGLGQQRDGNVITVMTLEKMKKDEADRVAVQKQRDADRLAVQKKEDEDKLREPQITRVVPIAYNSEVKKYRFRINRLPLYPIKNLSAR
jgi:type IV pilus assembly protein PilQ